MYWEEFIIVTNDSHNAFCILYILAGTDTQSAPLGMWLNVFVNLLWIFWVGGWNVALPIWWLILQITNSFYWLRKYKLPRFHINFFCIFSCIMFLNQLFPIFFWKQGLLHSQFSKNSVQRIWPLPIFGNHPQICNVFSICLSPPIFIPSAFWGDFLVQRMLSQLTTINMNEKQIHMCMQADFAVLFPRQKWQAIPLKTNSIHPVFRMFPMINLRRSFSK